MSLKHEYKLKIRYSDVDPMKIVHNSKYLIYFEEARIDLVRKENYSYDQIEKEGYIFPISELKIKYRNPIYYDDEVSIFVFFGYLQNFSIKINYQIIKSDGTIVCEGYTVHAFIDKKTGDFVDIPKKLRKIFEKYVE